jgi:hypothetical protein
LKNNLPYFVIFLFVMSSRSGLVIGVYFNLDHFLYSRGKRIQLIIRVCLNIDLIFYFRGRRIRLIIRVCLNIDLILYCRGRRIRLIIRVCLNLDLFNTCLIPPDDSIAPLGALRRLPSCTWLAASVRALAIRIPASHRSLQRF